MVHLVETDLEVLTVLCEFFPPQHKGKFQGGVTDKFFCNTYHIHSQNWAKLSFCYSQEDIEKTDETIIGIKWDIQS